MIKTDEIEIWNLSRGGAARCGAVQIFNVVGRVADPGTLRTFTYRLNNKPEMPVFFAPAGSRLPRLGTPGNFSIDTIKQTDLALNNTLLLRTTRKDGRQHTVEIPFRALPFEQVEPRFCLMLDRASAAEEVGQIVEGPWRLTQDESGRRCLEITPEDAGYDRIILFGRMEWTTGYEIRARLSVTRIIGPHNIGIVFKWNPHEQGDGTRLPATWSTGLGYYCSYADYPGIRIRFGVRVRRNERGRKQGDYVLAKRQLNTRRRMVLTKLMQMTRLWPCATDLVLNRDYSFVMRVHPERYELTVRQSHDAKAPRPLAVDRPVERLSTGSVGVLAYRVGVRLYDFQVTPFNDSLA